MIKKTTKAVFKSGSYAGEYDWEGGIPLSEGEIVSVTTSTGDQLEYVMLDKSVSLVDKGQDQIVSIEYTFDLAS